MAEMKVSVIIPTLNAESEIGGLIDALLRQELQPDEVIVIDSSSDDGTRGIVRSYQDERVRLIKIERKDFNHGLTRDHALKRSTGDVVCFMTQDAFPANNRLLADLIHPILTDSAVAISSGRQVARSCASRREQLVRAFNYPVQSDVRTIEDVARLGIKAYFSSDTCAAYRRSAYLELGGFGHCEVNEDMLMAARALSAGWKVAYAANAVVLHSHDYSFREQFERNRMVGRFLERNADLLSCSSEMGEGVKLAHDVASTLLKEMRLFELLIFGGDCMARLVGNRVGRREARRVER